MFYIENKVTLKNEIKVHFEENSHHIVIYIGSVCIKITTFIQRDKCMSFAHICEMNILEQWLKLSRLYFKSTDEIFSIIVIIVEERG